MFYIYIMDMVQQYTLKRKKQQQNHWLLFKLAYSKQRETFFSFLGFIINLLQHKQSKTISYLEPYKHKLSYNIMQFKVMF